MSQIDVFFGLSQQIEAKIQVVYEQEEGLEDQDVEVAMKGLMRYYTSEQKGHTSRPVLSLSPGQQMVFDVVFPMTEMHLGRGNHSVDSSEVERLPVSGMVSCLTGLHKKIRKLARKSAQGYLTGGGE